MEDIHSNEILRDIKNMFNNKWNEVESNTIPEIDDVALSKNESVKLSATVLYVDMRNSTKLVSEWKVFFSTKIYKIFLWAASKVIQKMGGHITAFDGDRVMAIFIGNCKNTTAVKTAMKIKYLILQINKEILKDTNYTIDFGIGIDTGLIFATRTGICLDGRKRLEIVLQVRFAAHAGVDQFHGRQRGDPAERPRGGRGVRVGLAQDRLRRIVEARERTAA